MDPPPRNPNSRKRRPDPEWTDRSWRPHKIPRNMHPPVSSGHHSSRAQPLPQLQPRQLPHPQPQAQRRLQAYKPVIKHSPHPDSAVGQNFHWVPYPLSLMPYDSWHALHHRQPAPHRPFRCPVCRARRNTTPHIRKLFLVAERLSWVDGLVSTQDRHVNEELTWEVNFKLGIHEPFTEDPDQVPGGKNSQRNQWYPYQNQFEMQEAFGFIRTSRDLTEAGWALWFAFQKLTGAVAESPRPVGKNPLQLISGNNAKHHQPAEEIDLAGEPHKMLIGQQHRNQDSVLTPPSSYERHAQFHSQDASGRHIHNIESQYPTESTTAENKTRLLAQQPNDSPGFQIVSYKTLPEFYSLLDKIERTSFVGAQFLEAYAEHLRDDACRDCWFKMNIDLSET